MITNLDVCFGPLLLAEAVHFRQQDAIITGDPSHADLPRKAEKFKAPILAVLLTPDYKLNLEAMEKKIDSHTALVYLCNPDNPTSPILDTVKLKVLVARVSQKTPIFIDELFGPRSITLIAAVKQGQNVLVARAFSKTAARGLPSGPAGHNKDAEPVCAGPDEYFGPGHSGGCGKLPGPAIYVGCAQENAGF